MNFNSWWLTCSYSFHFWDEGSQTALNRVFYFENLSSEAVQIAHISEDWLICAAQKVISWGEIQYPGSPCMRQTEKKSVQRECHRNPKQHIPQVRKRLHLLHCLTDSTHFSNECVVCVSLWYNEKTPSAEAPSPGSSNNLYVLISSLFLSA